MCAAPSASGTTYTTSPLTSSPRVVPTASKSLSFSDLNYIVPSGSTQVFQELSGLYRSYYQGVVIERLANEIRRDQRGIDLYHRAEKEGLKACRVHSHMLVALRSDSQFVNLVIQYHDQFVNESAALHFQDNDKMIRVRVRAYIQENYFSEIRSRAIQEVAQQVKLEYGLKDAEPSTIIQSVIVRTNDPDFEEKYNTRVNEHYFRLFELEVQSMYEQEVSVNRLQDHKKTYEKLFITMLDRQRGVGSLLLLSCKIDSIILKSLLKALHKKDNIVELDLTGNQIDDEGAMLLEAFALSSKVITKIDLKHNRCVHYKIEKLLDIQVLKAGVKVRNPSTETPKGAVGKEDAAVSSLTDSLASARVSEAPQQKSAMARMSSRKSMSDLRSLAQ